MRRRVGLRGTLSVIAVGVALSAGGGTAIAQQTANVVETETPDLAIVCQAILETKTRNEFRANALASAAFENDDDVCHDIAVAHWARLDNPNGVQTGALDDDDGGYSFI